PSPVVAGTPGTFVVTALDSTNGIVPSYTGTVHFTSSDTSATLPANYTFTAGDAGVHTFTNGATLVTAGSQSITATDVATTSITGAQTGITVNAAAATSFTLTGAPATRTAGSAFNLTGKAFDTFGNLATGYRGIVHFTTTDGAGVVPGNYTYTALDAGQHVFSVTLKTAGNQTVTATDTVTASLTSTTANILVTA